MSKMHSSNTEYNTSAVLPLPFVNMYPINLSTICTCLQYVAEQRSKCGQSRITVTFDQPLYAKAREMVLAAGPHIVLFPTSSFDSEDSTSCFPSLVPSVSLWPEVDWKRCGRPYMRRTVSFTSVPNINIPEAKTIALVRICQEKRSRQPVKKSDGHGRNGEDKKGAT